MSLLSPGVERRRRRRCRSARVGAGRRSRVEVAEPRRLDAARVAVLEDPDRAVRDRRGRAGRSGPRTSRRPSRRRCRSSPRGSGPAPSPVFSISSSQVARLRRAAGRSGTSRRRPRPGSRPRARPRPGAPRRRRSREREARARDDAQRRDRDPARLRRLSRADAYGGLLPKARGTYHRSGRRTRSDRPRRVGAAATVMGGGRPSASNTLVALARGTVRGAGGDDGQISR